MRELSALAREEHAMYLWKFYADKRDGVRRGCLAAADDVPWLRRRKFRKCSERLLGLTAEDLTPPNTFSAKDQDTREREFQEACVKLGRLFEDLANAA